MTKSTNATWKHYISRSDSEVALFRCSKVKTKLEVINDIFSVFGYNIKHAQHEIQHDSDE